MSIRFLWHTAQLGMQYPGKITAALESVAVITHQSGDAA